MNDLAHNIDSAFESQANFEAQFDCDVYEVDFRQRESLSENFNEEIEAWARHALATNGFGDFC